MFQLFVKWDLKVELLYSILKNFLTELTSKFPGPQLVQVLSFLQDLKENSNTGQLRTIIEEGKILKVFEGIGVLQIYQSLKTITLK